MSGLELRLWMNPIYPCFYFSLVLFLRRSTVILGGLTVSGWTVIKDFNE